MAVAAAVPAVRAALIARSALRLIPGFRRVSSAPDPAVVRAGRHTEAGALIGPGLAPGRMPAPARSEVGERSADRWSP
ncbi:hypothetical protein ACFRJ1_31355 [Streptomyces sp. NPDC056773]|uniref:hypothetical protein n=1 Tax=unclassified Streptomyces TaxID=2593676 RepID=UPI0036C6F4E0